MAAIAPNWKASVHTTPTRPTHRFQLVTTPTSSRPSRLWRRPKPSISVASEELALRCKTKITEASDTAASAEGAFRDTTLVTTHTLETPQTARAKDTERVRAEDPPRRAWPRLSPPPRRPLPSWLLQSMAYAPRQAAPDSIAAPPFHEHRIVPVTLATLAAYLGLPPMDMHPLTPARCPSRSATSGPATTTFVPGRVVYTAQEPRLRFNEQAQPW